MEITKERLLKIQSWSETYGLGSNVVLPAEEAEELARIALASLETEAVAWRYRFVHTPKSEEHGSPFTTDWVLAHSEDECNPSDCFERQPLFTAPPVPASVTDERAAFNAWNNDTDCPLAGLDAKKAAWLAWSLRAAMLQGAENAEAPTTMQTAPVLDSSPKIAESPSGNSPFIPDGWVACSERMPDENAEQEVLACFKGGDISTLYYFDGRWDDAYGIVPIRQDVTHWMPLPLPPTK